jgi:C-terminal processing protease CtpA/Prc
VFQRCIVVQEVFPEGLVSQDGRLKPGDQLIEINGMDMTNASHHQVSRKLLIVHKRKYY